MLHTLHQAICEDMVLFPQQRTHFSLLHRPLAPQQQEGSEASGEHDRAPGGLVWQ